MTFPEVVRNRRDYFRCFVIGVASTLVLYHLSNNYQFMEPRMLSFDFVDRAVPFLPWSVWIYFSEYVIFVACWLSLGDNRARTKYFYSYMGILIISVIIFVLYPTTFPRADYPLSADQSGLTYLAFQYFRDNMDTPVNCLPSLHVSTCFISAFAFIGKSRPKFFFFLIWSCLVAWSTLATKQHYFADVWTAVLLVSVNYWYFFHVAEYVEKPQ